MSSPKRHLHDKQQTRWHVGHTIPFCGANLSRTTKLAVGGANVPRTANPRTANPVDVGENGIGLLCRSLSYWQVSFKFAGLFCRCCLKYTCVIHSFLREGGGGGRERQRKRDGGGGEG